MTDKIIAGVGQLLRYVIAIIVLIPALIWDVAFAIKGSILNGLESFLEMFGWEVNLYSQAFQEWSGKGTEMVKNFATE